MANTSDSILRPHMPELDTLRGIAVLLVLAFHASALSPYHTGAIQGAARWFLRAAAGGWIGVNLFFVLSGFLITGILLETISQPGYYQRFYTRRALRILPAYYAILIVLVIVTRTGIVDRNVSWPFLGLSFIYLANVTAIIGVPAQYAVLWSLAVEEHFYLFWPAVVQRISRRALLRIAVGIILLCPLLRAFCYWQRYNYGAGYTWLVADGLACGALLALLARGALSSRRSVARFSWVTILLSLVLLVSGLPFGVCLSRTLAGAALRLTFLNILFTGLLAATLILGTSRLSRLVQISWLRFFGEISYGLYLVHMLVFDVIDHFSAKFSLHLMLGDNALVPLIARVVLGSALSIAIAYLSRWYFEEPFLRLKNHVDFEQPSAPVLVPEAHAELAS
jgi:peptidoglycan/LPS O-acetylase OafA/YrhL